MGKKPSKVPGVNMVLLSAIVKAAADNTLYYVSQADGLPLANYDPPLIEVNPGMPDPSDATKAACRPTAAGQAMVANASMPGAADTNPAAASPYAIIKGAVLPASKKRGGGGGAPTIYPFKTMEIGDTFFVPVSEKHPNPVKTLGSTVSSANMRFAVDTGEKKTVTRNKRGPKNKLVLDTSGNPIPEQVTLPVYKHTRKFSIRPVVAGTKYGEWVAPANGALIARVNLKED